MNPRYLVTYKHYNGQSTVLLTTSVGRFYDPELAEARARELFDRPGNEITSVRQETDWEATKYKATRFSIRTLRVIAGCAIGVGAFLFLYDSDTNIGDVPFSSLTLNMILSSLFRVALLFGAASAGWFLAFGKGPSE